MVVLVTGASGQFGQALRALSGKYPEIGFYFSDSDEGNITDIDKLTKLFAKVSPTFCINAAAYTAVDKSESEPDSARLVNVDGAKNLAQVCDKFDTTLIHISTDFVFDGSKTTPYTETDATNPQGVYGLTKKEGEDQIRTILKEHFIIRTSWLYSEYGNNFMKTMLRLAKERDSLGVVDDQIGTPTNANDLADAVLKIILSEKPAYGTYHFSNEGVASWYDFAREIFEFNNVSINLNPIPTSAFPTPAKRPAYSVLDKNKIKKVFGIEIKEWSESLRSIKL